MKSKKQIKRTRKYKRVKSRKIKGGKILYKNGKWVAEVNHNTIQNDNVRIYREAEARMMNLLKIPDGRPLNTILSDIPYVTGFFNSVDFFVQRRIIANLETAIDYRQRIGELDAGHKHFLDILNALREALNGIFSTVQQPEVAETPWHTDELKETIDNLKEQEEFLKREIDRLGDQLQSYIDKLSDVKQKLEAAIKEYEDTQKPGLQLYAQPIKSKNPFDVLASTELESPSSPTKSKQPELAELAEEPELKPKKLEQLLDETKMIDEAIAKSKLERLSAEDQSVKADFIQFEMPLHKSVYSLPEKISTSEQDIQYVEFLSEQNYRICHDILSNSPDSSDNLRILSTLFKSSGKIIKNKKEFDKYVKNQNQILYVVIYWFIYVVTSILSTFEYHGIIIAD